MRLFIATVLLALSTNNAPVLAGECLREEIFHSTLNEYLGKASSIRVTPVTWFDGSRDAGSYQMIKKVGPEVLIQRSGYNTVKVTVGLPTNGKTPQTLCFGTNPEESSLIEIWEDDG